MEFERFRYISILMTALVLLVSGCNSDLAFEPVQTDAPSQPETPVEDTSTYFPLTADSSAFTLLSQPEVTTEFVDLGFGSLLTFSGDAPEGDANTLHSGYRLNRVFTTDAEIRLSVYLNDTTEKCNDAGIVITSSSAQPFWVWNAASGRLMAAMDCADLMLSGESEDQYAGVDLSSGQWVTYRVVYLASQGKTFFQVYAGRDSIAGSKLGETFLASAPFSSWQLSLWADQDDALNGKTQVADLRVMEPTGLDDLEEPPPQ